ncbi:MAG: cadherin domain-containing protein [Pseudomonadota bacterium]
MNDDEFGVSAQADAAHDAFLKNKSTVVHFDLNFNDVDASLKTVHLGANAWSEDIADYLGRLDNRSSPVLDLADAAFSYTIEPVVGTLGTADPDAGDSHVYTVSDARFEVADGALKLKDGVSLDHETEPELTIAVTATDQDGLARTEHITLSVDDVNETATDLIFTSTDVSEDALALWLDASDLNADGIPDSGIALDGNRWLDKSGNGHSAVLKGDGLVQDEVGLALGETGSRFTLASDQTINKGTFAEKTFAISFETGEDLSGLQMIYEQGGGIRGYSLSIAEHPDTGEPTLYAMAYNKKEWDDDLEVRALEIGTVEPNTFYNIAMVHDATAPDLADRTLTAFRDGELISSESNVDVQYNHPDAVGIGDINNHTVHPVTGLKTDEDAQFNGTISEIVSWNRALSSDEILALDQHFESNAVQTSDDVTLSEAVAPGTVVATLAADDQDAGDTSTFDIVDEDGAPVAHAIFEVVDNEIRLRADAELDHESAHEHVLNVQVTDGGGNTLVQPLTINVLDVNEGPTDLVFTPRSVPENAPDGAVVGTLEAFDEDQGDHLTFSIVDAQNRPVEHALFEVDGTDIRLRAGAELDHDSTPEHTIRVAAMDGGGETVAKSITISVDDENEVASFEITGTDGDDILSANAGDDTVFGGSGDDVLAGGAGDDTLFGGEGDDLFTFGIGDGSNVVQGGAGWIDAIEVEDFSISTLGSDWTVTLDAGEILSQDPETLFLSENAAGQIDLSDGTRIEFSEISQIYT